MSYLDSIPNVTNDVEKQNGPSILPRNLPKLNDPMALDDTKYTTYIYDIDHEIRGCDHQEDAVTLLPGITGTLMSIPKSLLTDVKPHSRELVLYQEPTSLTIPKEQDNVRRAIAESRARARARQGLGPPCTASSSNNGNKCVYDGMGIDAVL